MHQEEVDKIHNQCWMYRSTHKCYPLLIPSHQLDNNTNEALTDDYYSLGFCKIRGQISILPVIRLSHCITHQRLSVTENETLPELLSEFGT